MMMGKRGAWLAIAAAGVLGLAGYHWWPFSPQTKAVTPIWPSGSQALNGSPVVALKPPPLEAGPPLTADDRKFIDQLHQKFAAAIGNKHVQVRVIEQLMDYLKAHYPEDWQARLYDFLKQLFPDRADALYARSQSLQGYNDWLRDNRTALMMMPAQDRQAALWAARHDAFGDDATEIWAGEVKNEKISGTLAVINAVEGKSVDEKLSMLLASVNEAYGDEAPVYIADRQTELLNSFIGLDSIQDDLAGMDAEQQHASLRGIRSQLGMDSESLLRWDELDDSRDRAWNAGRQYMAEREKIIEHYKDSEREQKLRQLQDRVFGSDASTLRAEENAGFYRYAHRRRIGRE